MESGAVEERLRLQFGSASTTIGTRWYTAECSASDDNVKQSAGLPRVLAFEAKGRIRRLVSAVKAVNRDDGNEPPEPSVRTTWGGGVQVYDHGPSSTPTVDGGPADHGLWNWGQFSERNLVEIDEFRPHMPLHNFYEGQCVAREGNLTVATWDAVEDRLRGALEASDNLRFVETLVDMDSAWGGLATEVLAYLNEECASAVVVTFGNDWAYPLPDQAQANAYSAGPDSRDQTKVQARRRINLASSVASLVEHSSVFVPLAMQPPGPMATLGDCYANAGRVAMALETAMSPFRRGFGSIYSLLEGIIPSTKIMELSALIPYAEDPTELVVDRTSLSEAVQAKWLESSLLPASRPPRQLGQASSMAVAAPRYRFRRLHLRGHFSAATHLQETIDRFQSQEFVVQWSPRALDKAKDGASDRDLEGVSQLSLSTRVGTYVRHLTDQIGRHPERRVLYEFTQAGMNVDALSELQAALGDLAAGYASRSDDDDDDGR